MTTNAANLRYLIDSYLVWAARENIPLVESAAVDLNTVETAPWPRLGGGCRGAFVHLRGRGDFVALQVIDIPPRSRTNQLRHLYDEVFHVLAGHGSASVDLGGSSGGSSGGSGGSLILDWGPRTLFSPPLNAPFRLFNTSRVPARLVCVNDLPFVMNVYRNELFIFDNPFPFPDRAGRKGYFAGEGDFHAFKGGTHMWETQVVPDVGKLKLEKWDERGAGGRNVNIVLADSSMHMHVSELAAGTYNKGRYGAGPHVFPVTGSGYTLVWNEGDTEFERHDWRHGVVFVAPPDRLHQHFNTGAGPARHLAVSLGSRRYPVLARIARRNLAPEAIVKDGGVQVDFTEQDPRIHPMWLAELKRAGVPSRVEQDAPSQQDIPAKQDASKPEDVPAEAREPIPAKLAGPPRFLCDSYLEWTAREGIPVHERFGVDLLTAETGAWPRLGDRCKGAFVHLKGRGDWTTVFLIDVPPGQASAPQQHLFDEMFYVISGTGSVVVESPSGEKHAFEWGPRSLFAPPLNARYRIFNSSGREPVRLASANDMRILMNIFHDEVFLFDNPFQFPEREGLPGYYGGEGEMTSIRPGRNLWETNFVPDLGVFELRPWEARGAGSSNMQFLLGEGSMGAHASEMPVGTYKKGHRHGPGLHIFPIHGSGYTLLWYEGDRDFERIDWRHGMLYAPPENMFHQHFNTSTQPARYIAVGFGSKRYPIVFERRVGSEGRRTDVSVKDGGSQIEYQDQDPRIHALWLEELSKAGVASRMGKFFDETPEAPAEVTADSTDGR